MEGFVRLLHLKVLPMVAGMKRAQVVALTGVGALAYFLGDGGFFFLCLIPVGFAVWFLGWRSGVLAAAVVSVGPLWIETMNPGVFSPPDVSPVSSIVRFGFLMVGVSTLSEMKRTGLCFRREIARHAHALRTEVFRRRALEQEIIDLYMHNRGRLAQQIHDELGQYVSASSYHSKMLAEDLQAMASPLAPQADRIRTLIRVTNEAIRGMDSPLQVPDQSVGSLMSEVENLAADVERLTGVTCRVQGEFGGAGLSRFCSLMLFLIVQEACSNAVKHGSPKAIALSMTVESGILVVVIEDDGVGFAAEAEMREGLGLRTMRHRADLIGASLRFSPAPKGCMLECTVPLGT